ncbi:MAG: cyclic nucleotide-binding domain-containing protein [Lachnospiraceae bacterium]|nr:cyclic nucleotide-binding domain-containing protein [Lachnospiraceae bacterium]
MGIISLQKGDILHKAGDTPVSSIEVVLKGKMCLKGTDIEAELGTGSIIGIAETPKQKYVFTYEALEECSVYSYAYESDKDIPNVITSNPKIAPVLASQTINITLALYDAYVNLHSSLEEEYNRIKSDYAEYNTLCIKAGEAPKTYDNIAVLTPPERKSDAFSWKHSFIRSIKENESSLKKSFYTISPEICTGVIMLSQATQYKLLEVFEDLDAYRKDFKMATADFAVTINRIRAKIEGTTNGSSDADLSVCPIKNAISVILSYSEVDSEVAMKFEEQINAFKKNKNRYDSSDDSRILRRNLANSFYEVYTSAFKKAALTEDYPIELKMFFMFGFVDEELAGEKNTFTLYNMAKSYVPDPDGNVLTIYEWLHKIYAMEADPSINEFDQDWPTYIREQRNAGDISQDAADNMINDPDCRLEFEIKNLFILGNRMTFGRVTTFVPVFDEENIVRPLDASYITTQKVNEYYENIRNIDFGVFCRQSLYSNPKIGVPQLRYAEDITPYMILLPNIGSRTCLWQEIEGKRRTTKARMLCSIFNVENTDDCMLRLFAEFRWEMCKTEQGVHWNDVRDPSLTSLYCDYLQFYKKNSALTTDNKEKVKTELKKYGNNFKNVFISDYMAYIKYESNNSPRLNKVAREILFTFCPFKREIRDKARENPQYTDLLNRYSKQVQGQLKPMMNLLNKLERENMSVPKELMTQIEYLEK